MANNGVSIHGTDFEIVRLVLLMTFCTDYQTAKHEYLKTGKVPNGYNKVDLDRGFITSGLWSFSRHPNFFAEQAIWFILYQWSCYSSNAMYSFAATGPILLILLFQGSTMFTESISAGKYPEYLHYQRQIPMFLPIGFGGYEKPAPKVIRTSELAKKQQEKEL